MRCMNFKGRASHPIYRVMVAPILRLSPQEMSPGGGLMALLTALLTAAWHDITFGIFALMIVSGVVDTIYGRRVARAVDEYDSLKAEMGLHSKIMGLILALLVRGFELWWTEASKGTAFDGWHTYGALAAAIAVTLFVSDLKSIEEKRIRFGQGPIPVLGHILKLMDRIATSLGAPEGDLQHRRSADEEED